MNFKKLTIAFIVVVLAVIIVYDIFAIVAGGYDATISSTLYASAKDYPVVSFALGFVMGHIFWLNAPAR